MRAKQPGNPWMKMIWLLPVIETLSDNSASWASFSPSQSDTPFSSSNPSFTLSSPFMASLKSCLAGLLSVGFFFFLVLTFGWTLLFFSNSILFLPVKGYKSYPEIICKDFYCLSCVCLKMLLLFPNKQIWIQYGNLSYRFSTATLCSQLQLPSPGKDLLFEYTYPAEAVCAPALRCAICELKNHLLLYKHNLHPLVTTGHSVAGPGALGSCRVALPS